MLILPKALESDPWGKTPKPPDWLLSSLQADGCVPRHPLQIRFMVGRRGRFALDGSQVGSSGGDRFGSVKLALLDRNPLRVSNAKRPLSFGVNFVGGGFGGSGSSPDRGFGGSSPKVRIYSRQEGTEPYLYKGTNRSKGV